MSSSYSIVFWFSLYTYIFISIRIFKFVMFSGTFCRFLWLIDWLGSCVIIQTRYTLSSIKLYSRNIRVVGFTFNNSTSGNQGCIIRLLTLDEIGHTFILLFRKFIISYKQFIMIIKFSFNTNDNYVICYMLLCYSDNKC